MQIWSIKEKWRERNWRVLEMFLDIFLQGEKRNSGSEIGLSILLSERKTILLISQQQQFFEGKMFPMNF